MGTHIRQKMPIFKEERLGLMPSYVAPHHVSPSTRVMTKMLEAEAESLKKLEAEMTALKGVIGEQKDHNAAINQLMDKINVSLTHLNKEMKKDPEILLLIAPQRDQNITIDGLSVGDDGTRGHAAAFTSRSAIPMVFVTPTLLAQGPGRGAKAHT